MNVQARYALLPALLLFPSLFVLGSVACNEDPTSACPPGTTEQANGTCLSNGPSSGTDMGDTTPILDPQGDADSDGVINLIDNCDGVINPDQADDDVDGVGNVCDNCPMAANTTQTDTNSNSVGDACEGSTNTPPVTYDPEQDSDNDGIPDREDNCPGLSTTVQSDSDGDGRGDACDNCITTPNADQTDTDGDMFGDACSAAPMGMLCGNEMTAFQPVKSNIHIILDRSGSMCDTPDMNGGQRYPCEGNIQADSKWVLATTALNELAGALQDKANLGLSYYGESGDPRSYDCSSVNALPMGQHSASEVMQTYANLVPSGGTPTGSALRNVRTNNWLNIAGDAMDEEREKVVILITDGEAPTEETCAAMGHSGAVTEVEALLNEGYRTFAIGFGSGANRQQLIDYAAAGGTDFAYVANDTASLSNILTSITNNVVGCEFALAMTPPDSNKIWVTVDSGDGAPQIYSTGASPDISYDSMNNSVAITGATCDNLRMSSAQDANITIEFGCSASSCTPSEEECDYMDNDCDGEVDEGCPTAMCTTRGNACTANTECCNMMCNNGICDPNTPDTPNTPSCMPQSNNCSDNEDCCNGDCFEGICNPSVPDPDPSCISRGRACTDNSQCCSGSCGFTNNDVGECQG